MMRQCLDCPTLTITVVCPTHAAQRQQLDGPDWFTRLREDLWAKYPDGDWNGFGPSRKHPAPAARRTRTKANPDGDGFGEMTA